MKFDWDQLPAWLRAEEKKAIERLCADHPPEATIALRTRIKVYREILALPNKDPNEGYTVRDEDV